MNILDRELRSHVLPLEILSTETDATVGYLAITFTYSVVVLETQSNRLGM